MFTASVTSCLCPRSSLALFGTWNPGAITPLSYPCSKDAGCSSTVRIGPNASPQQQPRSYHQLMDAETGMAAAWTPDTASSFLPHREVPPLLKFISVPCPMPGWDMWHWHQPGTTNTNQLMPLYPPALGCISVPFSILHWIWCHSPYSTAAVPVMLGSLGPGAWLWQWQCCTYAAVADLWFLFSFQHPQIPPVCLCEHRWHFSEDPTGTMRSWSRMGI